MTSSSAAFGASQGRLQRRDLDREGKAVLVRRTFSGGQLRDVGETERSRRKVPLRSIVLDALELLLPRLDSPLLFPALGGGHMNLHNFRASEWIPAVKAAGFLSAEGKATKRIYDLRHTYATMSLAAGVSLFTLARRMGTSVEMIDRTYGHWPSTRRTTSATSSTPTTPACASMRT